MSPDTLMQDDTFLKKVLGISGVQFTKQAHLPADKTSPIYYCSNEKAKFPLNDKGSAKNENEKTVLKHFFSRAQFQISQYQTAPTSKKKK